MDLRKLQSEVDVKRSFEVFETLRADTNLFSGWSKAEIEKLCENIKIVSFGRGATILHKNELIEYFALVLGGKLLINQGDNSIGYLEAGDVVGYMAYLDFAGTKASPFEITGDVEGYIAVFRYDEFKMLSKKEPQLSYKLTEMLAKKALNTVSLQYTGEEIYTPFKLKAGTSVTNTKKVKDAMDTCPELADFFERLDQRDRKNLTKSVDFIEFEREQKVVQEGKRADYILILTKGELIGFRENKPAVYYKPGSIIGKKEFFFGLTWQENILGKAKGVLLKLERSKFEELIFTSNQSANNLMKSFIWHECKEVKHRYQERPSMFDKIKDKNITNPLNEFIEYEITKHLDFVHHQQQKLNNTKPLIKDFLMKKEVLPLYMHSIHQSLAAANSANSPDKRQKAVEGLQGCIFLREKLEKQIADRRKKKGKERVAERQTMTATLTRKTDEKPVDEDYEDLKNNFVLLERENEELRAKLNEILDDNKELKNQLKYMRELSTTSTTKINKSLLHKELMSKDLINNDPSSVLTRNYNMTFSTFGDVLKEQHLIAARAKRVAKYAYRWLAIVRTKRKSRMLG